MIYGNQTSYRFLQAFLSGSGSGRTLLIRGPAHAGKSTALTEAASALGSDALFPGHGVDGARESVEFSGFAPTSGPLKAICVPDADLLTDAARDAYLKLSEETPRGCCVVFTSSDPSAMAPALLSRVRDSVTWTSLDQDEIRQFAESLGAVDEEALVASCGLPGMYSRLAHQQRFRDLAAAMGAIIGGTRHPMLDSPPQVIEKLDAKSDDRAAVVHTLHAASRSFGDSRSRVAVLDYVRTLATQPSANAEIHWYRMASRLGLQM